LCELVPVDAVATVEGLERLAHDFLGSDRVVALIDRANRRAREPQYSTPELLALERRILAHADEAESDRAAVVSPEVVDEAARALPTLSGEQREMVRRLTLDRAAVAVVVGKAGTGKTFALAAVAEACERSGRPVAGAAGSRRAAVKLARQAGIEATSVTALLHHLRRRPSQTLPHGSVLVLDEAGMLPSPQAAQALPAGGAGRPALGDRAHAWAAARGRPAARRRAARGPRLRRPAAAGGARPGVAPRARADAARRAGGERRAAEGAQESPAAAHGHAPGTAAAGPRRLAASARELRPAALPVDGGRLLARVGLAQLAQGVYRPVAEAVGLSGARPYDLRHAFASLLIHEGRLSVVEIAAQLGHNPTVCLDTYAHVMAEPSGGETLGAEEQIAMARRRLERGSEVSCRCRGWTGDAGRQRRADRALRQIIPELVTNADSAITRAAIRMHPARIAQPRSQLP
jgi:hypothetical protein